jgi:hypothetical protein
MIDVVDVAKQNAKYAALKTKWLSIFIGISALFLAFVVTAILLSPEHYDVLMWALIALGTLYVWWTLYFFSVLYREILHYHRFYENALHGLRDEETLTIVSVDPSSNLTKEGLDASLIKGSFKENGKTYERDLYVLNSPLSLQAGQVVRVKSFDSVLLSYEVLA